MDDAVDRLDSYIARIGQMYNLEELDERALTGVKNYALPGFEAVPSLADLQAWLAVRLAEA